MSELGNTWDKGPSHNRTVQKTPSLNHVSNQKWTLHLKKRWISKLGKSVAGIISLFVDDLFGTGGKKWNNAF